MVLQVIMTCRGY